MNKYSQWFDACSPVQMHPRLRSGFPSRAIGLRAADAVLAKTPPPATGGTDGFTHRGRTRLKDTCPLWQVRENKAAVEPVRTVPPLRHFNGLVSPDTEPGPSPSSIRIRDGSSVFVVAFLRANAAYFFTRTLGSIATGAFPFSSPNRSIRMLTCGSIARKHGSFFFSVDFFD